MNLTVIIPAGGSGSRIGGKPKQYRMLGDKPVLSHTVRAFIAWRPECRFVIAVPPSDRDYVASFVGDAGVIEFVAGGEERQDSVRHALESLGASAAGDDIVFVHDAVRPFVDRALLDRVLAACIEHGAAAPAVPVADTLRQVRHGRFDETVPREGVFRMQTPQAFRAPDIAAAHACAARDGVRGTDDVELYQRYVGAVAYVEGSETNVKITTTEDLAMAVKRWET